MQNRVIKCTCRSTHIEVTTAIERHTYQNHIMKQEIVDGGRVEGERIVWKEKGETEGVEEGEKLRVEGGKKEKRRGRCSMEFKLQ